MTALGELFGARINRARKARGWSVRELAEKAGIKQSTADKIVSGAHEPLLGNAVAVAEALGLDLGKLTAAPSCTVCDGTPPPGMTCNACGRGTAATS
jgi:transcriptional regulator with XRE-family HTH domain